MCLQSQHAKIFVMSFKIRLTHFIEFEKLTGSFNGFRHSRYRNSTIGDLRISIHEGVNSTKNLLRHC